MKCINLSIAWIGFFTLSLYYLIPGIKGFVGNKPFLIHSRWFLVSFIIILLPMLLSDLRMLIVYQCYNVTLYIPLLMLLVILLIFWKQHSSSYTVYGVTDDLFHKALQAALVAKSIPYEKGQSKITLKDLNINLDVSVQGSKGTGEIKIGTGRRHEILDDIASEMGRYLKANTVSLNRKLFFFQILNGLIMLIFGIWSLRYL